METEFLDQMHQAMEQFLALPMEKKQEYSRKDGSIEGYGNDMVLSDRQTLDWHDRLCITISPKDLRQLKFWPQNPPTFR